jgi:hypothetical protein
LVIAAIVSLIAMVVFIVALRPAQIAVVANCMSVVVLLPLALLCVVPQLLLFGLVFGTNWLHLKTGLLFDRVGELALRGRVITLRASSMVARPVMRFNQAYAGLDAALQRLRPAPHAEPRPEPEQGEHP